MPDIDEKIGAVERKNPLPTAVYWVDVFSDDDLLGRPDFSQFESWLEKNRGKVRVIRTEEFSRDVLNQYPARRWYLFEVLVPVQWEGPGFPTISERRDISSEDTAHVGEGAKEWAEGPELPSLPKKFGHSVVTGVGTAVGFAFAGYMLTKLAMRKSR